MISTIYFDYFDFKVNDRLEAFELLMVPFYPSS